MKELDEFQYAYPLVDWGWTRADCEAEIAASGLPVPHKSSCYFCPSMKPWELRQLATLKNGQAMLRTIVEMEYRHDVRRQAPRREAGKGAIMGLWRTPTRGVRDSEAKPGTFTELIVAEELLPEFEEQDVAEPWWWFKDGKKGCEITGCHKVMIGRRAPRKPGTLGAPIYNWHYDVDLLGWAHERVAEALDECYGTEDGTDNDTKAPADPQAHRGRRKHLGRGPL